MPVQQRLAFAAVSAAFTALFAAALVVAAALVTPPVAAIPVVALACIGAPMAATFELGRELDRLPETPHPHGY